jgi:hypothetical protein
MSTTLILGDGGVDGFEEEGDDDLITKFSGSVGM